MRTIVLTSGPRAIWSQQHLLPCRQQSWRGPSSVDYRGAFLCLRCLKRCFGGLIVLIQGWLRHEKLSWGFRFSSRLNRAYLGHENVALGTQILIFWIWRADLRPDRADLRPKRAYTGCEKTDLRLFEAWGANLKQGSGYCWPHILP